jgi:hypothetical protein
MTATPDGKGDTPGYTTATPADDGDACSKGDA